MSLTEQQKESTLAIKDLIASGDIKPNEDKATFLERYGHEPVLSEDDVINVYASQDDDYGIEDILRRMLAVENKKPLVWEGEQPE